MPNKGHVYDIDDDPAMRDSLDFLMTERARAAIGSEAIEAVADRGYYSGEEIVVCEEAGITVYLPKPMTSGLHAKGRFGKQDFVYVAADDVYLCPAGEQLPYRNTNEEDGKILRRYWTTACQACALKGQCTTGKERRISRWDCPDGPRYKVLGLADNSHRI
jgi:Transposase DDE domain